MLVDLAVDGGRPVIPVAAGLACPVLSPLPPVCCAVARGYAEGCPDAKVAHSRVFNAKPESVVIVLRCSV